MSEPKTTKLQKIPFFAGSAVHRPIKVKSGVRAGKVTEQAHKHG